MNGEKTIISTNLIRKNTAVMTAPVKPSTNMIRPKTARGRPIIAPIPVKETIMPATMRRIPLSKNIDYTCLF
jgi:hypothetical protein